MAIALSRKSAVTREQAIGGHNSLDYSHPFAKHLRYGVIAHSSGELRDLLDAHPAAPGDFTGDDLVTPLGVNLGDNPIIDSMGSMTIVTRFKVNSSASSASIIKRGSPSAGGGWELDIGSNSSKRFTFIKDGSGGNMSVNFSSAYAVGDTVNVTVRWDGVQPGTSNLHMDVGSATVTASSAGTYISNTSGNLIIGDGAGRFSYEYMYVLDTELSYEEAQEFHRNPYQLLKPRNTYFLFPESGAAPTATKKLTTVQTLDRGFGQVRAARLGGILQ